MFPIKGLFLFFVITVPAFVLVGLWFVFQLLNRRDTLDGEEAGGVAYANRSGFILGIILVKLFVKRAPLLGGVYKTIYETISKLKCKVD